ncbi:hypothetical protein [Anaerosporobacter sp.]|uniref:hypothetical protein n=1 Tax=Anaerosporobacter sp. TaxID=1872529 RepID=UPI00286F4033|nr:hypothetical protein [Anaerosporobacter sp.]
MKLRYKKMILIISMSAMGIGMVTLSLSKPKEKAEKGDVAVTRTIDDNTDAETTDVEKDTEEGTTAKIELVGEPNDGELRMDIYPAINDLIKKYMTAKAACDYETIRTLVGDTSVIDEDDLRAKSEYIEEYRNLACYTLNGPTKDSFVVYVYEDLKILNIETLAPGMTRLYIKLDESGNPYIYLGAVDDETQKFIQETSNNQAVIDIITAVNTKLEEVSTRDEELKKFIDERTGAASNSADKKTDDTKKDDTKADDKKSDDSASKDTKDKEASDKN